MQFISRQYHQSIKGKVRCEYDFACTVLPYFGGSRNVLDLNKFTYLIDKALAFFAFKLLITILK